MLIILHGTIPFVVLESIRDIASAIFESASGFTTTGATVITDIEAQPKSILFWRSFSHWLGGMGIIVLSLAILPELAVGGMQLFSAESSGLGVEKLVPRIAQTAKRLWWLYAALTVVEILLLLMGGMSIFDSVNHSLATTATGGFSPLNESIGTYSNPESIHFHEHALYFETIITIFMFLAGINFALQYRVIVRGELKSLFRSSEIRLYLLILVVVTSAITVDLFLAEHGGLGGCFRDSSFQTVAILTTTGFGTDDFDSWPTFSKILIVAMMAVGGCAGSTAGGLKVIRLVVVLKHAARECRRLLYPHMIRPVNVDGKAIDDEVLSGVLGFFTIYMIAFLATTVLLCALPHSPAPGATSSGIDLVTASTAALSALNSIGPGLGRVGPTATFEFIHPIGKLALSFCMLLGRLEIYTLLVLFLPSFWSRKQ
jgi:trk system potassium uptake protein TrkH